MKVKVRFFALYREQAGITQTEMEIASGTRAADLLEELKTRYPRLRAYSGTFILAINSEYAELGDILEAGDEMALIPPVSGGIDD